WTARQTSFDWTAGTSPRNLSVQCRFSGSTHFTFAPEARRRSISRSTWERTSGEISTATKVRRGCIGIHDVSWKIWSRGGSDLLAIRSPGGAGGLQAGRDG